MKRVFPALGALIVLTGFASAQEIDKAPGKVVVPRKQTQPPGPPLSAEEAARKMTVPEGFTVEVVAAEPDLVNPVAMSIDDRGRFWITESLEYPRKEPGPGRDRVKVLEDTDQDGRVDKVTVFAEGLNIPSGIAVGHGGVWVANAPDLLFLRDTDGDLRADTREVVVTGFGRTDTHELPNSLVWGPDGFLYGLNGVFNHSKIAHRGETHEFTCAMFRVDPVPDAAGEWAGTRRFELFAEGTSNPWGIAWNGDGEAFLSACVIDHLWHLSESGYYHRQGGPYPAHTWKLGSIVAHQHQMAAYCGIEWFDSDAYPAEFRERLYMGNIHGGCVNSDALERRGSSYFGTPRPDFLSANDVWHMPVAQKTGPDGCLYILDWYDRYHCYQDANADPAGVDRARGRLYRVRYHDTPRAPAFDLEKESDAALIARLASPNLFFRERAQRLLAERLRSAGGPDPATVAALEKLVLDEARPQKTRRHALWALIGSQRLEPAFHLALLRHPEPHFRAWAVRAAGNFGAVTGEIRALVADMARDESPDVQRQVAIAATKIEGLDAPALLGEVLARCGNDETIPRLVWQNLHPELERRPAGLAVVLGKIEGATDPGAAPGVAGLAPYLGQFLLDRRAADLGGFTRLLKLMDSRGAADAVAEMLAGLGERLRNREVRPEQVAGLRESLEPVLGPMLEGKRGADRRFDAALLASAWRDEGAMASVKAAAASADMPFPKRAAAIEALAATGDDAAAGLAAPLLEAKIHEGPPTDLRRRLLAALGRLDSGKVAATVLAGYPGYSDALRRDAIELLTGRPEWSRPLIAAVESGAVPKAAVNPMQARKMASGGDDAVKAGVEKLWGAIRAERNPGREAVIARVKTLVGEMAGDWRNGEAVFARTCAACHKLHGKGNVIGPDITVSGRGTLDQLLSNVLDPNLVIGAGYQARLVTTRDGRTLMGLPVEDNDRRLVLRPPAGKDETIARADVEKVEALPVSLMPEGLESTMSERDLVDLIAYLAHDKHPSDPAAEVMAGVKLGAGNAGTGGGQ
ncbi:MAG: HEAT repeat domain-containing protein [Verrucomicrobiae bacterium]|nr:HEAT repeat domain-containing protein [Verrucomicrobiae bacterium]